MSPMVGCLRWSISNEVMVWVFEGCSIFARLNNNDEIDAVAAELRLTEAITIQGMTI